MDRKFAAIGAISGFLAVGLGAFGAHTLRASISEDMLRVYEVGSHYHLIHALALLATAWGSTRWPGRAIQFAGWSFLVGTVLFSGSLYALAVTGYPTLGMITPVGGIAFMIGWGCFAFATIWGESP